MKVPTPLIAGVEKLWIIDPVMGTFALEAPLGHEVKASDIPAQFIAPYMLKQVYLKGDWELNRGLHSQQDIFWEIPPTQKTKKNQSHKCTPFTRMCRLCIRFKATHPP